MIFISPKQQKQCGFSLIEVMVSLLVLMILMLGIYGLIILSLNVTNENKSYVEAMEIANQKMERVRNLPYDDVGTLTGSPVGVLPEYETIEREGRYLVHNMVMFYDDPYDGTIASGTDTIFVDYKIVTVDVSWRGKFGNRNVTIFSKVIPATEETLSGYGLLKLEIVDANGAPVAGADIHVENNIIAPVMSGDYVSDANGILALPVLPSFEGYEITVTKPGYGTDATYDRTAENPNPSKPHLSLAAGAKTEESFCIDLLSQLTINTITADLPDNWQINSDTSGEAQTNAKIAIDDSGNIYMVWEDYRQSSASKIMAQKYNTSAEAQWPNTTSPEDQFISTSNDTVVPDIMADIFGNLYVAWYDDSTGNKEAYLVKRDSADGSDVWGAEKKINVEADAEDQFNPRIALADDSSSATTTVTWSDDRNGDIDIYLQIFSYDGNLQLNPEIRVNRNALGDGTDQTDAMPFTDSAGNSYIVWTDDRNGDTDVYMAKYTDAASYVWEYTVNGDSGTADQLEADIAIDGSDNIYVVWSDERNTDRDIYAQKFNSNGIAQWASDVRVNTDAAGQTQSEPALAIANSGDLYIVWTDERNGNKDIYAQKYDPAGSNIWVQDLRININADGSDQYNPDITINPINGSPYATWQDERNGDLDIYATSFDVYGASSSIQYIPLAVTGTKQIGDGPVIYEYDREHTTDAGGQLVLQLEWDAPGYTIDVVAASTSYSVILSDPGQPVELPPDADKTINLYLD